MQVIVGVSNRHVHLTKEVYEQLFFDDLECSYQLHQIGEFASNKKVTLKTEKGTIEEVRVVGPLREYNQVEIARSDAFLLGLNPPVRRSGDINKSESITLVGPKGEVYLESVCIIADRHVHMNPLKAKELGVVDNQMVKIKVHNDKSGVMDASVKISDNGYFELHIDRDDANAFHLKNGDVLEMSIENEVENRKYRN